jgi:hypothetical protein
LVKGLGKIAISPDHSISNVFLVDSLDNNLLSVSQLCNMGYNCLFTDVGVTVFRRSDDSIAFKGVLEGQLYLVDFNRAELDTCLIAKTNMGWLWHHRLAHVGMKNLHKLLKGKHIFGLTNVHFEKDRVCSACQAGKQVGAHHPHKNIMTTDRPLELLHLDLFGPIAYISISGSKYCLVIVDDYSHFTWVFLHKEDAQQGQRPPHPRVHQAIQRDHPVNSILGDIHKGVTTRSRVAHFCEHYSFVSSIEPYRVEDTLRDSDWVLAMQEELNNFTRNEV